MSLIKEMIIPKGVICFTNPDQIALIRQIGLYGNVAVGDIPKSKHPLSLRAARRNRFGKLKDLLCVVFWILAFAGMTLRVLADTIMENTRALLEDYSANRII